MHRKHLDKWNELFVRCGDANAREIWDHLTTRPDQPPKLGSVTPMKGALGKAEGQLSRVYHYELTGAGRVDYRYAAKYTGGADGDEHRIVQIVSVSYSSH